MGDVSLPRHDDRRTLLFITGKLSESLSRTPVKHSSGLNRLEALNYETEDTILDAAQGSDTRDDAMKTDARNQKNKNEVFILK